MKGIKIDIRIRAIRMRCCSQVPEAAVVVHGQSRVYQVYVIVSSPQTRSTLIISSLNLYYDASAIHIPLCNRLLVLRHHTINRSTVSMSSQSTEHGLWRPLPPDISLEGLTSWQNSKLFEAIYIGIAEAS